MIELITILREFICFIFRRITGSTQGITLSNRPPINPNIIMTTRYRKEILGLNTKSLLTTEQMSLHTKKSNFKTSFWFLFSLQWVWYLFSKIFLKFSWYLNSSDFDFDTISGALASFHPFGNSISNVAVPSGDNFSSLRRMSPDSRALIGKFIKMVKTKTEKTRKKYFILVKN